MLEFYSKYFYRGYYPYLGIYFKSLTITFKDYSYELVLHPFHFEKHFILD
jgi:hypothetical protein